MSLVKSGITWLRQTVAMSNTWPSWQERLILALFLLIAVALGFLTAWIDLWKAAIAWGVFFIAMAVCSRQGWLKLFGPVLFYDMVRTARRSRYVIMRLLYALVLLGILVVMFLEADINPRDRQQRDAAVLAQTFFSIFMIVQLVMVVLLTPAYVAGAIAEEKDRKTLEFMLATDLSNREIILSKLLSRVGNMTLLLLTGLPILSILQFLGGVDAELMLAGFAATGLTMLGIASVGILLSTLFQKPRDAIGLTYLFIITYVALATTTLAMDKARGPIRGWMDEEILYENGPTYHDVSKVLNAGNPIAAIESVGEAMNKASLGAELPGIVHGYAWFHGVLSLICIGWSIFRLRTIALMQTVGGKTARLSWWERYRAPVGEVPMMWKELNIEGRMKLNWLAWGVVIVLVLLTLGSGLFIIGLDLWSLTFAGHPRWQELMQAMNIWFRIAGTGVGSLMILMVAVRASTSITNERERDTFDALITTPMSANAMLGAKLLGCITSLRMGWLWFGSMLAVAVLTGGIHLLAVPLLITEWFVYAVFFAMVGIGFSMSCQSSMRATVYTVMTTLMLGGGHWLVMGLCCYFPAAFVMRGGGHPGDFFEYLMKFQAGMTPPFVFFVSAYSWEDLGHNILRHDARDLAAFSLVGLFLWGMGSLILWYGVLVPKFRLITRREELIYQ